MKVEIIHTTEDFIVVNKPPGISVHGGDNVTDKTLADFLIEKFPEIKDVGDLPLQAGEPKVRPGIVHRLDKNTSGVMMVARNQKSFLALKDLFQKRLVEKTYHAIVCGVSKEKEGVINLPIGRVVANPLKRGVALGRRKIRGEREAFTEYKTLKGGSDYSLLEVRPRTGRMHQIRVHLAAIHRPVACDTVYGGKNVCCPEGASRQMLHAAAISFSYPEGKKWRFEAGYPEDFQEAVFEIEASMSR